MTIEHMAHIEPHWMIVLVHMYPVDGTDVDDNAHNNSNSHSDSKPKRMPSVTDALRYFMSEMEADQRHAALAGLAVQTADRLPHVVPTPDSTPPTEPDLTSWQAHSFQDQGQVPLQVWYQLKATAVSYLPKTATAPWSLTPSGDRDVAVRRDVYQVAKQALPWSSLQQLGSKLAGRLPGVVPTGLESSVDEEEQSQVGSGMA